MKKQIRIQAILKEFADINTVPAVSDVVRFSPETVRVYSNYMVKNGLLEKISSGVVGNTGRPKYAYVATGLALTDEILKQVQLDIYFHYENMKKAWLDKQHEEKKKAIVYAKSITKADSVKTLEKSDDEKKGIYLLSSNPSKHFKDKFKEQSQLATIERKSPKNYAGTSAGMVW